MADENEGDLMKVKDLEFHSIEGNAPVFTCNNCGKRGEARGWFIADIAIGEGSDTASIVVCSRRCEQAFKHHPMAQKYVNDMLSRVYAMRSGM